MKYKLGEKHKDYELYRVIYLRDIPRYGVKDGDIGGWIEHEGNLSQNGDCVVLDEAWVSGNAQVFDNAQVFGDAQVFANASVSDNAVVSDNAQVYGNAVVSGNARVFDNAQVSGNARVSGSVWVGSKAKIGGNMALCEDRYYSEAPTLLSQIIERSRA